MILPDEESVIPLLIGRDILKKLNIFLCNIKFKYNQIKLLELNPINNNKLHKKKLVVRLWLLIYTEALEIYGKFHPTLLCVIN